MSQITLITSDEKRILIEKSILSVHSKVFKGMLELDQKNQQIDGVVEEVTVTEKASEVELMVQIFNGEWESGHAERDSASRLAMTDLLIRLGDKYDAQVLTLLATSELWPLVDDRPLDVYCQASLLGLKSLIIAAASASLEDPTRNYYNDPLLFRAGPEARFRLLYLHAHLRDFAQATISMNHKYTVAELKDIHENSININCDFLQSIFPSLVIESLSEPNIGSKYALTAQLCQKVAISMMEQCAQCRLTVQDFCEEIEHRWNQRRSVEEIMFPTFP